jgi:hypothetical protein
MALQRQLRDASVESLRCEGKHEDQEDKNQEGAVISHTLLDRLVEIPHEYRNEESSYDEGCVDANRPEGNDCPPVPAEKGV